jgi:UDP-N-acetylmuramate--alanine ligase
MHIYFSGIGGAGIGPLALIAKQAGYEVSGSDMQSSTYTDMLLKKGIHLHIGQEQAQIAAEHRENPIDWIVFSSAIFYTNPNHPELQFAKANGIKFSKRDECLNEIIQRYNLKLIAIAGTHGKTTTTALTIWLLKELGLPISYSVGAKIDTSASATSLAMGQFDTSSQYFIYECDEFDRNFLSFKPFLSIITTIDWDHHDIYPTFENYKQAFCQFINQSQHTFIYDRDAAKLGIPATATVATLDLSDQQLTNIKLAGQHNRQNAWLVIAALSQVLNCDKEKLLEVVGRFPGSARRFEKLAPNIYSDYAHTPEEIAATLQLAREVSENVVVVYEPLTNRRQHFMQDQYTHIFEPAKKVYWLPSYLAREDPKQTVLSPEYLISKLSPQTNAVTANKTPDLLEKIAQHANNGDLVLCMAGGGGDSLDEWLRANLVELQA